MKERYLHDIAIALEAIMANKVKSLLTALGIIFGVAAVISMLAIGNGAQQEILEQMKMVGVNNIIVLPVVESQQAEAEQDLKRIHKFTPGLTMGDLEAIRDNIPVVQSITPQITKDSYVIQSGIRRTAKIHGVGPAFFELFSIELINGKMFSPKQIEGGLPVCIISEDMAMRFFSSTQVEGKVIKCGKEWLTIVGVAQKRTLGDNAGKLGLSTGIDVVYVPVQTMLLRFENRALITSNDLKKGQDQNQAKAKATDANYHQLDKIIVQVKETNQLQTVSEIVNRLLLRRHQGVADFEVVIPELLLKQQQRTKDIFNIVLGAIAGISLLVGGIGIMNIMLASVLERVKEIGTRMALGATRKDIIVQFISESTIISISGGLIGIILGFILSMLVTRFADILTIISPGSVFVAFGISVSVGILFGYMPARKASMQHPVVSLRAE